MNRLIAVSLFAVAASFASCEFVGSSGKFMQSDDGARAGKIALVSLYADIEGLNPSDPELAKLESGLLRDVLIAAEDALNEKFDVQPASGWVADAGYRKHATAAARGVQLMPSLDGQKLVRLTAAPDDTLPLHLAGQLADDLGVRYIAVLETSLSARMVQVKEVGSVSQRGNSPVQMLQRMVFAKTRLTIYKNGFPEVVAEQEVQGSPINTQIRLIDQFKERRDSTDSLTMGACKSAAGAVKSGVKAVMDKIKLTPRGFDYQG